MDKEDALAAVFNAAADQCHNDVSSVGTDGVLMLPVKDTSAFAINLQGSSLTQLHEAGTRATGNRPLEAAVMFSESGVDYFRYVCFRRSCMS